MYKNIQFPRFSDTLKLIPRIILTISILQIFLSLSLQALHKNCLKKRVDARRYFKNQSGIPIPGTNDQKRRAITSILEKGTKREWASMEIMYQKSRYNSPIHTYHSNGSKQRVCQSVVSHFRAPSVARTRSEYFGSASMNVPRTLDPASRWRREGRAAAKGLNCLWTRNVFSPTNILVPLSSQGADVYIVYT